LSCRPKLLIADEPTTALDPTIQAQILELIRSLQRLSGMSVLYISHDLGVIAEICNRVAVMYAGVIVEIASVRELFHNPRHPYTRGLLRTIPKMTGPRVPLQGIEGTVPHFSELDEGCPFHNLCRWEGSDCLRSLPPMRGENDHGFRCNRTLPDFE
jgi:oligopeptide/dipeptide ABC transporter ATP-binding protein